MTQRAQPGPALRRQGRDGRTRPLADALLYRSVALLGVAGLAVLLWAAALPQAAAALSHARTSVKSATVVSCPPESQLAGQCRVRYVHDGREVTAQLARSGVTGVGVGDRIPVWFDASGAPSIAGWRAWVDALVLLTLAVAGTVGAVVLTRRCVSLDLPEWDPRSSLGPLLPRLR